MFPRKVQLTIQQESFQQGRERKQEAWYCVFGQSPEESLRQEALQPLQEIWGHVYNAQHKGML